MTTGHETDPLCADEVERFRSRVERRGADECWLWMGTIEQNGYGTFHRWHPAKRVKAHRAAFMIGVGPIPEGLFVCHRCDVRACVNPAHLFVGTAADNAADRHAKGRDAAGDSHGSRTRPDRVPRGVRHGWHTKPGSVPRGERNGRAKLSAEAVREIRSLREEGATYKSIAARFGVSRALIYYVARRDCWRHV